MTGYEAASLTMQHAALWIAAVGAAASFVNAVAMTVAAIGIWRGIAAMEQQGEAMKQQREADQRRHEEVMAALAVSAAGK